MASPDRVNISAIERYFPRIPSSLKIGKEISRGSYGTVHEGQVNDRPVAVKRIHRIHLEPPCNERTSILLDKFQQECSLLEEADNVHVVQLYGTYYDEESQELILVMEKLQQTLIEYLSANRGNLSLQRQAEICLEIVNGVHFLHSLVPPVIHLDLNDKNVMLTEEGLVKVGDLGQSCLKEGNIDYFTTAQPGAIQFMPPEALQEAAHYDEKIDTFSIGVLMLEIATQQSPQVGLVGIGAVPEVKRREKDLSVLSKNHPLYSLILNCLKDNPEDRPTAVKLTQKLQELIRQNQQTKLIVQYEPLSEGGKPSGDHQTAEQTKHIIPEKGGPNTSGQEESKLPQQAKPKPPEPVQRKRRIPVPKDPNVPVDVLPPGTVVEGIYSFQAIQESDLSFEKGDKLEITASAPKTANWYSARRVRDGCVGEIPSNYVSLIDIELVLDDAPGPVEEKIPVDLSPMNWYHGNLSNSESEALLKGRPNGTYLVRNSDKNSGQFTLCLRYVGFIADSAKTANTAHNTSIEILS
jgi:serine/threonine protein kinase